MPAKPGHFIGAEGGCQEAMCRQVIPEGKIILGRGMEEPGCIRQSGKAHHPGYGQA